MKKIIKLTESDLFNIVKKVLVEQNKPQPNFKFDTIINKSDTTVPSSLQNNKSKVEFEQKKINEFLKGIVPVKTDSAFGPHIRVFTDFLTIRKSPITTKDFTSEELKTILSFIKNSKVGKNPKNINFTADVDWSKIKSGEESQLKPDIQKSIGYTLGNARVQDMGNYYKVTDIYDFNNYYNNPDKYTLSQLPNTVGTSFKKLFSGNLVQGVEELASYYHKLGYKGIPVSLDIPKNLV
jgi:hypothetical protein